MTSPSIYLLLSLSAAPETLASVDEPIDAVGIDQPAVVAEATVTVHLATIRDLPAALGRSPEHAQARAAVVLRAQIAAMNNDERAHGLPGNNAVDLADVDADTSEHRGTPSRLCAALGAHSLYWDARTVRAELVAIGLLS